MRSDLKSFKSAPAAKRFERSSNAKPARLCTRLISSPADKVQTRDIVTSGTEGAYWLVDSGLKAGDRVIVEGILKIRPGQTVAPVAAGPQPQKTDTLAK